MFYTYNQDTVPIPNQTDRVVTFLIGSLGSELAHQNGSTRKSWTDRTLCDFDLLSQHSCRHSACPPADRKLAGYSLCSGVHTAFSDKTLPRPPVAILVIWFSRLVRLPTAMERQVAVAKISAFCHVQPQQVLAWTCGTNGTSQQLLRRIFRDSDTVKDCLGRQVHQPFASVGKQNSGTCYPSASQDTDHSMN